MSAKAKLKAAHNRVEPHTDSLVRRVSEALVASPWTTAILLAVVVVGIVVHFIMCPGAAK